MTFHKLDHNQQNYPDFYEIGEFYNVGKGLRELTRKTCDQLVSIPMHGAVSSLNVSVATGVLLFEALRQRSVPRG